MDKEMILRLLEAPTFVEQDSMLHEKENLQIFSDLQLQNNVTQRMNDNPSYGPWNRTVRLVKHDRCALPFSHNHDYFEIIYVLYGSCEHLIANQRQEIRGGDLCILSPAIRHATYVGSDSMALCLLIATSDMEKLILSMPTRQDPISAFLYEATFRRDYAACLNIHAQGDSDLYGQFLAMYAEEFSPDEFTNQIISGQVQILLAKLIRRHQMRTSVFIPEQTLCTDTDQILRYIRENCTTATLAELAQMLGYSVPYCSTFVKTYTGKSFSQLQKQFRLERACAYLLDTDMSIEHISERIGYANPEGFMRMFKKAYGLTPTMFRTAGRTKKPDA